MNNQEKQNISEIANKRRVLISTKHWPSFFTCGGYTNNSGDVQKKYLSGIKTGALYSYSGRDKQGDRGVVLNDGDLISTKQTLEQAKEIQEEYARDIMPTMVHYTANLLSGNTVADFTNLNNLKIHFMNLIKEVSLAQGFDKCSFILSPGFLGKIQQLRGSYPPYQELFNSNSIEVNQQLRSALSELGVTDEPINFNDNLPGYCQAINWIFRNFGPDISFGWVISPWQADNISWVFGDSDKTVEIANKVNAFLNEVGVYQNIIPDFIVFDSGEPWDSFSQEGISRGYAWNATAWRRYLKFVGFVSTEQKSPAILYQISGGHMPPKKNGASVVNNEHAGSGGSFFMGDPEIKTEVSNTVVPALLQRSLVNYPTYEAKTVEDLLAKDTAFDWSSTKITLAINANVFAIYFGSPQSTSIVSSIPNTADSWLAAKTTAYYGAPIPLS